MVRVYYKSIFDVLDDMRSYMDTLFRQFNAPGGTEIMLHCLPIR